MLTKYAEKGHAVYLFVASDGALGGDGSVRRREQQDSALVIGAREVFWGDYQDTDRKSTRLNSSHLVISYAVFCLKKKKPSHQHREGGLRRSVRRRRTAT